MTKLTFSYDQLKDAVRLKRYKAQYHAMKRMFERNYSYVDIENIILTGEIVEHHPKSKPYAKCLIMASLGNNPTYVSVAYDPKNHYAYIITIHGYDPEKWIDPRTRRKP